MDKKIDRRILKTKRAIKEAYIELLSKYDYDDITIKELADTADVDRKTIYNYYNGIYDLQDELEADLIKTIEEASNNIDFEKNINNPIYILKSITQIIDSNKEIYSKLININSRSNILRKIINVLKSKVKETLSKLELDSSLNLDIISEFITSGILNTYQFYVNSNQSITLEEASKQVGMIIYNGLLALKK